MFDFEHIRVSHDFELFRYVQFNSLLSVLLMYKIERQLYFPAGMNKVILLLLLTIPIPAEKTKS